MEIVQPDVLETKDKNDLFNVIKQKTEFKDPGQGLGESFSMNDSDFQDSPYMPGFTLEGEKPTDKKPGEPLTEAQQPLKTDKVFDPDFTADIVIDTFDTFQSTVFLALNNRKQKNKRFRNREEYQLAMGLSYLTETEIAKLDNPEDKKILVEKLKSFQEVMTKINDKLDFTPDERMRLKKPVMQLVKQHNFDIPPGLALVMVTMDLISDRVVDLIMD